MRNLLSARPITRCILVLVTIVFSGGSTALLFGTTALATTTSPVDAGDVVVVDASNPLKELDHGGSATKFTLRLPADASCPGDSENDQWRVQSFLVPATDDPGALHYGEIAPEGDGLWALYSLDTHAFVHILTLANSQPGLPGRIETLPAFSFVLFPPGTLPDGHYRLGIACTLFRATAKYWDTELILTTSPDDQPGQLVWRVAGANADAPRSSAGSSDGRWAVVGVGVLGVAALIFVLRLRADRRSRPLLKEHS